MMTKGPNLRLSTEKLPDGSWKAVVVGQEATMSATGPTDMEAIRTLKLQVQKKMACGDLADLKQNMV
jgi:hypothetical protein